MICCEKVMMLISKAFLIIKFNHLTPFSDEKHQLHCSGISKQVLVCLPFISGNILLPQPTMKRFQFSF